MYGKGEECIGKRGSARAQRGRAQKGMSPYSYLDYHWSGSGDYTWTCSSMSMMTAWHSWHTMASPVSCRATMGGTIPDD